MMMRFAQAVIGLLLFSLVLFVVYAGELIEYSRKPDPTGQYESIVSCRHYLSWIPTNPGSGRDKACFVEIRDRNKGVSLGRVPVPTIQMAEVEWMTNSANIKLIAEWDLLLLGRGRKQEDLRQEIGPTNGVHIASQTRQHDPDVIFCLITPQRSNAARRNSDCPVRQGMGQEGELR